MFSSPFFLAGSDFDFRVWLMKMTVAIELQPSPLIAYLWSSPPFILVHMHHGCDVACAFSSFRREVVLVKSNNNSFSKKRTVRAVLLNCCGVVYKRPRCLPS
jgi:hypothetical protein